MAYPGNEIKNRQRIRKPLISYMAVMILLLPGCKDPHQSIKAFDNQNITFLELFLEQEERWVRAIYSMDSLEAARSVDSIRLLAATPWMQDDFHDLRYSAEFGNYVNTSMLFWNILAIQTDSVYKKATAIAFLPQTAYSKEEEEKLMEKLGSHDRTLHKLLDSINDLRKDITAQIY